MHSRRGRLLAAQKIPPIWVLILVASMVAMVVVIILNDSWRETILFILGSTTPRPFDGIWVTLVVLVVSYFFSLLIGLIFGLMRSSSNLILNNIAALYVEIFRGIPLLVLLLYIAFVATPIIIEAINGFVSLFVPGNVIVITTRDFPNTFRAALALALGYGAYNAEIFRAGIQSISSGQRDATKSIGLSSYQSYRYVILPQTVRNILPALGNELVSMVKDSSLVAFLGVADLTYLTRQYSASTFQYFTSFTILAAVYLVIVFSLSFLVQLLERKLKIPDK